MHTYTHQHTHTDTPTHTHTDTHTYTHTHHHTHTHTKQTFVNPVLQTLEWRQTRSPSVQAKLYKTTNRFGRPQVLRSTKLQMCNRPKSKCHKKAHR